MRLTVLGIVLKSKGFPESLPQARFCIWLRKNGYYDKVRKNVEDAGKDFNRELQDLYVSPYRSQILAGYRPLQGMPGVLMPPEFLEVTIAYCRRNVLFILAARVQALQLLTHQVM